MSRSTRSASKPLAPCTIRIHGKLKALPQFLSFKHYPKCGVHTLSPSETTNDIETVSRKRGRIEQSVQRQLTDGKTLASTSMEASHNKSKKQAAIESTHPPESDEIQAHSDYLNLECMRLISRELDNAVKSVLRRCESGQMVDECIRFFGMFSPMNEGADERMEGGERQEKPHQATGRSMSMFFKPYAYPPTLLPMVIIKCYLNLIDRAEMVQVLVHDLSNGQRNHRVMMEPSRRRGEERPPCVCVIRSFAELVEQGSLIAELLFQVSPLFMFTSPLVISMTFYAPSSRLVTLYKCIANDPNGKEFSIHIAHQRKRQKSNVLGGICNGIMFKSIFSYTQALIDWCSTTEEFDSIIVILEDSENIPSPDLDTFLTTLSSLRSNFGVPISIILMQCTPGGLENRLCTLRQPAFYGCGQGDGGVMQCVLRMPLPGDQFENLMNKLMSMNCIPTFLWNNDHLLQYIQNVFHENDNSIVGVVRRLKTELSHYFSLPGAFTSLLDCQELVLPNLPRISWLICQPLAKASPTADQRDEPRQHLATKIAISLAFRRLYQAISSMESSKSFSGCNLLVQLYQTRTALMTDLIIGSDQLRDSLIMQTNEFIILADEITNDVEYSLKNAMMTDVKEWASETLTSQHQTLPVLLISRLVQPRKDVAKAFVASLPSALNNSFARIVTIAFQCFQSRYLTLSDWYEKYFEIVTDYPATSSNESLFFTAVQELIYCGFIRKITSAQRKDETYEKIAIVWGK